MAAVAMFVDARGMTVGGKRLRVAVTGATGNVGLSLVRALLDETSVDGVVGIARRLPDVEWPGVTWRQADVGTSDLGPLFKDADAVVHLAWAIQPSHDEASLTQTNVLGSQRVFRAAGRANVPILIHASSVGAYSPGPSEGLVDETWSVGGVPSSFYSRHKAIAESMLDEVEREYPRMRIVRMRPSLIFRRGQGSEVRRLFLGPLVPNVAFKPGWLRILPDIEGLQLQVVHTDDVARAYVSAVMNEVEGPFNLAGEPILNARLVADALGIRAIKLPPAPVRQAVSLAWKARLQPTPPGWLDMGLRAPLMSTQRARSLLGWSPERPAMAVVRELLDGMSTGSGDPTPPLVPDSAAGRVRELLSGGGRIS